MESIVKNLEYQYKKFNIIINVPNGFNELEGIVSACNLIFYEWSFIKHDKDITDEGLVKTIHYHIVARTVERTRLSTILNKLCELLNISPFLITIDKCISYNGAMQYLLHLNDPNKHSYNINDIITSLNRYDLQQILCSSLDSVSIEELIDAVKSASNLVDVMRQIGLKHYNGYRNVIRDIWACKNDRNL